MPSDKGPGTSWSKEHALPLVLTEPLLSDETAVQLTRVAAWHGKQETSRVDQGSFGERDSWDTQLASMDVRLVSPYNLRHMRRHFSLPYAVPLIVETTADLLLLSVSSLRDAFSLSLSAATQPSADALTGERASSIVDASLITHCITDADCHSRIPGTSCRAKTSREL